MSAVSRLPRCRKCRGAGETLVQVHLFPSPEDFYRECRECHGSGVVYPFVPSRAAVAR